MILITGSTGLVGAHLLMKLLEKGQPVRALIRNKERISETKRILNFYHSDTEELLSKVEWVIGDVNDIFSLEHALEGIEYVYHVGGLVSFDAADKAQLLKVNGEGTANLVNICLEKKIKKLLHVSSIAVLGRVGNENELVDEETWWVESDKNSAYAVSKHAAEREVWRGIAEGLNAVIVNPSVIIGPGDWSKGSPALFSKVWSGLRFYTHGMNGYVDVRDVSDAMIFLMEHEIKNERFILNSENLDYKALFTFIAKSLGKKAPDIYAGKFLSGLAWRMETLRSTITRKKPLITRETARTANSSFCYSNKKITDLGFVFLSINQSINDTSSLFLKDYQ